MDINESDPRVRFVSLGPLYDFVKANRHKEEALRLSNSKLGREYCRLCDEVTEPIDPCQGFYLWGSYDKKGLWRNIYLGMAGVKKDKKDLRKRIREELKDERGCLWRHVRTEAEAMAIRERIHEGKYRSAWLRAFRKSGATHIIWVPAPQIADNDIRRVEADLIEALNPTANQVRPAPPKTLQDDTTHIFQAFRRSIHDARRSKFFIEVKC